MLYEKITELPGKELSKMEHKSMLKRLAVRYVSCVAILAATVSGFAFTQRNPSMSLEQMSKDADEIIVGNVVRAHTKVVGSHLETDYDIQIHENLKSRSGNLPNGKTFTMTVAGGVLEEPPLAQYAMSAPYMFRGEEVFLFLKKGSGKEPNVPASRHPNAQPSTLHSSYRVIGWNQGRFSVVTKKSSGEKVVTRVNLENFGLMNRSEEMQELARAVAEGQVPTISKPVVRADDIADGTRGKDPLEVTGSDQKKMKIEAAAQKGAVLQELRQRGGVPAQDIESFKAQVKNFVATGH